MWSKDGRLLLRSPFIPVPTRTVKDDAKYEKRLQCIEIIFFRILGITRSLGSPRQFQIPKESKVLDAEFIGQSIDYHRDLCFHHLLEFHANRSPDAVAIAAPGRRHLTYRRLVRQVNEVVNTLRSMGISRNDRVAVALPNGPEMAAAFLSVAAGATCAPLNPAFRANEFDFYLSDLKAKALIVQSALDSPATTIAHKQSIPIIELQSLKKAEAGTFSLGAENQPAVSQDGFAEAQDIALVLYTSGTTSRPKMVPLTHANLLTSAGNIVATLQLTEKDRCLNVMPLFHIHGLVGGVLSSMWAGSSVVCSSGFDPDNFFSWLEAFHPTWYTAVPTIHQAVLSCAAAHREQLQRPLLRFIRSSSAALPPQVMQGLEEVFRVPVIEAYGMTEASHQIASNPLPPRGRKPGSVGLAAGPEVAVMDERSQLTSCDVIGEIVTRGPSVMSAYANSPDASRESFTHGWFRTGDQGYLDADGYLFITGRVKEIINRGGEKISPYEVDEVIMGHPEVAQATTFAIPHSALGEDIAAAVILRQNATVTDKEILEFAAQKLAAFKVPRKILIVDEIPVGPTGKVQRIDLAKRFGLRNSSQRTEQTRADFVPPRTPLEKRMVKIWAQLLGLALIGVHDNFFDLGGHSLLAMSLIAQIEKNFHKNLTLATLFQAPTVEQLASILRQERQSQSPSLLIPLQPKGSKSPFFCHGASLEMALAVGQDQPFYGLQPHGQDGRQAPSTIEEMAADYIKEIRTIQPKGPYFLGGYSFGGIVAFEMAQQLERHGEKVALLVLIDPVSPSSDLSSPVSRSTVVTTSFRHETYLHLHNLIRLGNRQKLAYVLERAKWRLDEFERKMKKMACQFYLSIGRRVPPSLRMFYFFEVSRDATRRYVPQLYPDRIILFKATRHSRGWSGLAAKGLEVQEMPGGHLEMLRDPHAHALGEKLRSCLEQARAQSANPAIASLYSPPKSSRSVPIN